MRIFATSGSPLKICFEYSNTRKQDLKMFVLKCTMDWAKFPSFRILFLYHILMKQFEFVKNKHVENVSLYMSVFWRERIIHFSKFTSYFLSKNIEKLLLYKRHCRIFWWKKLISSSPSNRSNLLEETCGSHFDRRGYTIHSDVHTSEKGSQYVRSHAELYFLWYTACPL